MAGATARKFGPGIMDKMRATKPLSQAELLKLEDMGVPLPTLNFGNSQLGADVMGRFDLDLGPGE